MKIYIHTDLEGISGIDTYDMIQKGDPGREYSIERLMVDVNAAIDGAFEGGATQVTVLDSHAGGGNFNYSKLDKRVDADMKENGLWWGKFDSSYDATFFIGAHAMAGTLNAFLDHTFSGLKWHNFIINGRRSGELAMWATVAGHYDVPLIMMSGDDAACTEAREFFSHIECASVKRGISRNKAILYNNEESANSIREAAKRAISLIGTAKPYKPLLPMELKLELNRTDYREEYENYPGVERLDARSLRKVANRHLDILFNPKV